MPRINVEDSFWLDVAKIAAKVGDLDRAVGNSIRWFKFCQEKHKLGKITSRTEFLEEGFLPELIPIFARETPAGIEARGAEKHFAWLKARQEAGRRGGVSGGRKQTEANESKPEQVEPSSSSSSSPSYSGSASNSKTRNRPEPNELFESCLTDYLRIKGTMKGAKARARFETQIRTEEKCASLKTAISNYATFLARPENSYRHPKGTFETFLGTERSGFFWEEFIQLPPEGKIHNRAEQRSAGNKQALERALNSEASFDELSF